MAQSLRACSASLIILALMGSSQATADANISVAEAAAGASNARYWMQMQNAARTFGSGCSEDKCVEACEQEWEKNGEHCYLWNTEARNWTDAEDFCQQAGGHLASAVHTNVTNDFLMEGMKRRGLDLLWIGGNDIEKEGTWKWNDCTPWEDTIWIPGEPNNMGDEDCLGIRGGGWNWKWNDWKCSLEQEFVCSKKICSGDEATTPRDEVTPGSGPKEGAVKAATGDSVVWKPISISLVVTLLLLF